ncbi:MAG: enoyl-CoA hydratase-related protein [Bacteroidia bacterium]|nr:enoyl-CoA hydratase-related protein [Bacteroidia bacterium]
MYQHLLYEVAGGIATITLNRPDRFNAFNNELSFELIDVLKRCDKDNAVRVIVITGAGKAFCSGQDLKDVAGKNRSLGESVEKRYNPMTRLVNSIEKPFICRLNGVAAGAGAGLALACDYVIAAESASFVFAFVNIGLVLDSGSSWTLPRLVGKRKAFELATLGERISAKQALDWGMVNQVVPDEQLDETVATIAQRYANSATKAIGLMKRMLNRSMESTLEEALTQEMFCQEIAGQTDDYKEGVLAFTEKRKPNFQGK